MKLLITLAVLALVGAASASGHNNYKCSYNLTTMNDFNSSAAAGAWYVDTVILSHQPHHHNMSGVDLWNNHPALNESADKTHFRVTCLALGFYPAHHRHMKGSSELELERPHGKIVDVVLGVQYNYSKLIDVWSADFVAVPGFYYGNENLLRGRDHGETAGAYGTPFRYNSTNHSLHFKDHSGENHQIFAPASDYENYLMLYVCDSWGRHGFGSVVILGRKTTGIGMAARQKLFKKLTNDGWSTTNAYSFHPEPNCKLL